jgi:hypothetical protein
MSSLKPIGPWIHTTLKIVWSPSSKTYLSLINKFHFWTFLKKMSNYFNIFKFCLILVYVQIREKNMELGNIFWTKNFEHFINIFYFVQFQLCSNSRKKKSIWEHGASNSFSHIPEQSWNHSAMGQIVYNLAEHNICGSSVEQNNGPGHSESPWGDASLLPLTSVKYVFPSPASEISKKKQLWPNICLSFFLRFDFSEEKNLVNHLFKLQTVFTC